MLRALGRSIAVAALASSLFVLRASASSTDPPSSSGNSGSFRLSALHQFSIPSFSRQTKLPCSACHTQFPQLTSFGRLFKLNGYTLSGIEKVVVSAEAASSSLALDLIPPLSVMAEVSTTTISKEPSGTQNNSVEFPDQLSLFVGEAITPKLGTFLQFTYSGVDGSFGWDNADIRYASHATVASKPMIFGVTVNNSPTVQDVWNSTPVWGFPFASSPVAPGPSAAPSISDDLAQRVAGIGGYVFWNNLVYAELSGYRSAPQGGPHPADQNSEGTIKGITPYWRLALARDIGSHSVEIGTFGLSTRQFPTGVSGATNTFTDVGFDGQWQRMLGRSSFSAHGSYIHEEQTLTASFMDGDAANIKNGLRSWKLDGQVLLPPGVGAALAYFGSSGDADPNLYAPGEVTGSASGRPNSNGLVAELDYNPWLNTRLSLQYVAYTKFNGGSTGYDGFGRNASNNNTLYLVAWLVF